ncbi:SAM-dependent methyltransferase [Actinotalea sp. M2MS4P-6]|uniref:class I SAM-dependent methyltransferase n=1 Tax=Actinotalea sp. M2MS4P-6 TaxID=2983762 RepID=UPI0021E4165E|nr:SAM-dependent methyltransferase [Actinotalea sp. M2MS4P-6]MCV2396395.1 SAM-dependent methyltransferase [Actinotalea sp. M2MS4P-6]
MPDTTLPVPSPTALMSAAARAAHLEVDGPPHLLADPFAAALVEAADPGPLEYHRRFPAEPVLAGSRVSATLRSRFAEDRLAASTADQYVVLGAGLDSSALRCAGSRAVFEVDLPDVLTWRRATFAAAGIDTPPHAREVPVDLGTEPLLSTLVTAGLDRTRPAFVSWLGTTMYLDEPGARRTLIELGTLAPGTELVLDHVLPDPQRDDAGRVYARAIAAAAGAGGEPWHWAPTPDEVRSMLTTCGFTAVTTLPDAEAVGPDAWQRPDHLRPMRLVGLVHARVA